VLAGRRKPMRERRAPGACTNNNNVEMIRAQPLTFALNPGMLVSARRKSRNEPPEGNNPPGVEFHPLDWLNFRREAVLPNRWC
jgi:hypothetical protein